MDRLTYLVLGDHDAPGPVLRWPRARRDISAIYRARLAAIDELPDYLKFVTWFDGPPDRYDAAWPSISERIMDRMDATGAAIGYADEDVPDRGRVSAGEWSIEAMCERPQMIHHAVICRVSALKAIQWPAGCYHWETLAYGLLAQRGYAYLPECAYWWSPSLDGAAQMACTTRGTVNALAYLQGRQGTHFAQDMED